MAPNTESEKQRLKAKLSGLQRERERLEREKNRTSDAPELMKLAQRMSENQSEIETATAALFDARDPQALNLLFVKVIGLELAVAELRAESRTKAA
jgi:predicted nuclease with TOPRIM domain